MFGYVNINKPEIKFKDYDIYHSYYCGLCKTIKKKYGFFARFGVNYDLTFLAILLSGLYEPETSCVCEHCIVHPVNKHKCFNNKYLEYAADMNVYLTYLKCMDDWNDDKKILSLLYAAVLKRKSAVIEKIYEKKTKEIKENMEKLSVLERDNCENLDEVSGTFGCIMREIFRVEDDFFDKNLSDMGFFLGKFIYIMDAYEDLNDDKKNNSYNPLIYYEKRENFDGFVRQILLSMMAECCKSFEYLPIIRNVEILRNILYSGVWTKYNILNEKKN